MVHRRPCPAPCAVPRTGNPNAATPRPPSTSRIRRRVAADGLSINRMESLRYQYGLTPLTPPLSRHSSARYVMYHITRGHFRPYATLVVPGRGVRPLPSTRKADQFAPVPDIADPSARPSPFAALRPRGQRFATRPPHPGAKHSPRPRRTTPYNLPRREASSAHLVRPDRAGRAGRYRPPRHRISASFSPSGYAARRRGRQCGPR